jgi:hypothetical protein
MKNLLPRYPTKKNGVRSYAAIDTQTEASSSQFDPQESTATLHAQPSVPEDRKSFSSPHQLRLNFQGSDLVAGADPT